MTPIEEEALWACSNDYKAPRAIFAGIAERAEQPATEESVRAILLSLADRGYVQASRYDKRQGLWIDMSPAEAARDPDPWFITTARGQEEVEDDGD